MYKNIFQFNFASAAIPDSVRTQDTTKTLNAAINPAITDSLKTADSLIVAALKDSSIADSSTKLQKNVKQSQNNIKQSQNNIKPAQNQAAANNTQDGSQPAVENTAAKPDSSYIIWMKQTAKLYENMDPKKAAKIIESYSDNIARDIIYSMKQKKAADILSELNPDTANRITRAKSNAF